MNANPTAKRVIVYGDSYTFGKIPGGARYDAATRFTGVLQQNLGNDYEVIEEGLRGRMISGENKFFPHRDGLVQFDGILGSHLPVDLIVFMLGTNDTNSGSTKSPEEIASTYDEYRDKVIWWSEHLSVPQPKVILVIPPVVDEVSASKVFGEIFSGSAVKSSMLPQAMIAYANNKALPYVNASVLVTVSQIDGVHLDEENNHTLGTAIATKVREIL